jgi:hypothetical protein
MSKPFKIKRFEPYPEGTLPVEQPESGQEVEYEPRIGEKVLVVYWVRYPSYDFIFGVPKKGTPMHKNEIGCFVWRYLKGGVQREFTIFTDIVECKEIIYGFKKILSKSRTNSKHLWKKHNVKNE